MLISDEPSLRGFCARILGWSAERTCAIEHALRSIHLSITHRAALVLLGDTDLVPLAQALHRRTIGAERPFVVCDPRRLNVGASVRTPMNYERVEAAVRAARGGSLCVRRRRMPRDFSALFSLVRDPTAAVQLIVCADLHFETDPFLALPAPIRVPSLGVRANELPQIVDEYALDAIHALGADATCFTHSDRTWILDYASATLAEIEKVTLRLVALRMSRSVFGAAKRLGMSTAALGQWIERRRLPTTLRSAHAVTLVPAPSRSGGADSPRSER